MLVSDDNQGPMDRQQKHFVLKSDQRPVALHVVGTKVTISASATETDCYGVSFQHGREGFGPPPHRHDWEGALPPRRCLLLQRHKSTHTRLRRGYSLFCNSTASPLTRSVLCLSMGCALSLRPDKARRRQCGVNDFYGNQLWCC
jgi:hypothetical protein